MPVRNARSSPIDAVEIIGAREHNLKNLTLRIPRGRFVVVTGVSGSGKSTLAFDILFAEGQRRFLDSMNPYARQFVEQMAKPDLDRITGLPPTVSIEQRSTQGGGKSTVATVTEIHHFLRLLFSRLGTPHCPECQVPVAAQTRTQILRRLRDAQSGTGRLLVLAPVIRNRKGFHSEVAVWADRHGFNEIRVDGVIRNSGAPLRLDRFREHNIEIVVGSVDSRAGQEKRLESLMDEALRLGEGTLFVLGRSGVPVVHSTRQACPACGRSIPPLDPKHFSYNSPQGWCPRCRGFGEIFDLPDVDRGARADAIEESWFEWQKDTREICPDCNGARLNPISRMVRLRLAERRRGPDGVGAQPTLEQIARLSVAQASEFFCGATFAEPEASVARDILPEINERLRFLHRVGLGYLQLGRSVTTLSDGEAQRIRLAAQLGSNLSGVLYILDEPTIGLHPRDNEQLLEALAVLRSRGNSLVVVEHDPATMERADHVIDLGPRGGIHGGELIAAGTLAQLRRNRRSITGRALTAVKAYPARGRRRPVLCDGSSPNLVLRGACMHNLKDLMIEVPLARFVVVTGVSGSGKSTLVRQCLKSALEAALAGRAVDDRRCGRIESGSQFVRHVYEVDQSPIGRTPRSIPATYVGFFDAVRQLFAQVPEARLRGYSASRFSFNSSSGRCPACDGGGTVKLEMNFLPPAYVQCEACKGRRYNPETLEVEFRGKTIADVLELSVEEATAFFDAFPRIRSALEALCETGLDYLKLGQISPTLSGGEAQRLKLVTHLLGGLRPVREPVPATTPKSSPPAPVRKSLFILEEPTIGLHMTDVERLVGVLQRLVDAGHSVVVIEHNMELIAEADWVIDLGPEAGAAGGEIVSAGPPESVARNRRSYTGRFLRPLLAR